MDDRAYQHLADEALARIENSLKDVDPDDVDCERSGDVITLTFKGGARCVVNTQRPTRQMWLAANARAWHFAWEEPSKKWIDDKGQKSADGAPLDLYGAIARIIHDAAGIDLELP